MLALMQAGYLESGVTESVRIRRAEAQEKGTIRWIGLKHAIAKTVAPSLVTKATRYDAIDRRVSHPHAEAVFDRLQPAMVVTSSPEFGSSSTTIAGSCSSAAEIRIF